MPAATTFDYTTARFTDDGAGDLKLVRDWRKHKPARREVEVLFAHNVLQSRMLSALVAFVAAGELVIADGLEPGALANLKHYLTTVERITDAIPMEVRDAGAG